MVMARGLCFCWASFSGQWENRLPRPLSPFLLIGIGVIPHRHKDFLCWVSARPLNLLKHHPDRVSLSVYVRGRRPSLALWEILPSGETEVIFLANTRWEVEGAEGGGEVDGLVCDGWISGPREAPSETFVSRKILLSIGVWLHMLFLKSLHNVAVECGEFLSFLFLLHGRECCKNYLCA